MDVQRSIFADESDAKADMARLHSRTSREQRLLDSTPHGHLNTTSLVSAVRLKGVAWSMVPERPMDARALTLQPGHMVVLDSLSCYEVPGVPEAINATGAELWYLPPYLPDLNLIEKLWSEAKEFLRAVAARTAEAQRGSIDRAFQAVTLTDLRGSWIPVRMIVNRSSRHMSHLLLGNGNGRRKNTNPDASKSNFSSG